MGFSFLFLSFSLSVVVVVVIYEISRAADVTCALFPRKFYESSLENHWISLWAGDIEVMMIKHLKYMFRPRLKMVWEFCWDTD